MKVKVLSPKFKENLLEATPLNFEL